MTRVRFPAPTKIVLSITLALPCFVYTSGGGVAQNQESLIFNTGVQITTVDTQNTYLIVDSKAKNWIKFQSLIKQWREERGATSSITKAAMMPAYQGIIGMGEDAVPLIIKQLKSEGDDPDQWFWALESITGANPTRQEDRGNYLKMAQSWLKWDEENNAGYLAEA